jgi:hypothetical protein
VTSLPPTRPQLLKVLPPPQAGSQAFNTSAFGAHLRCKP